MSAIILPLLGHLDIQESMMFVEGEQVSSIMYQVTSNKEYAEPNKSHKPFLSTIQAYTIITTWLE